MKNQEENQLTNYQAFEGVNLSNARAENETYEAYRKRIKQNDNMLKLYFQIGREMFSNLFPGGVAEALANIEREAANVTDEELKEEVEKEV